LHKAPIRSNDEIHSSADIGRPFVYHWHEILHSPTDIRWLPQDFDFDSRLRRNSIADDSVVEAVEKGMFLGIVNDQCELPIVKICNIVFSEQTWRHWNGMACIATGVVREKLSERIQGQHRRDCELEGRHAAPFWATGSGSEAGDHGRQAYIDYVVDKPSETACQIKPRQLSRQR